MSSAPLPCLYDYALSGNCYKVRLLLAMLGIEHRTVDIEFYPAGKHREDAFLALNPLGELPVYVDGELCLRDSKAILVYLAASHDPAGTWWPAAQAGRLALTVQWMAFGDELTASAGRARLADGFVDLELGHLDVDALRAEAHRLLEIMDSHLWFGERERREWLVPGAAPTLAELACYPYTMLSEEGGIDREGYPAVRRWCDRVGRLPGFVSMPGVFGG